MNQNQIYLIRNARLLKKITPESILRSSDEAIYMMIYFYIVHLLSCFNF